MLHAANPHFMEIMPGVIPKIVKRFSGGEVPVIAGGLIETKAEITAALGSGALAISTGCPQLWEL
jgi:glycerol uptake operon antiterminator